MTDFTDLHPLTLFVYYLLLLVFGMTLTHPVFVCLSVCLTGISFVLLKKSGGAKTLFSLLLPLSLLAALINPLFSHAGQTILAYFPSGNALTLESILYGLNAAGSFFTTLAACFCVSVVMTDDKWIALFGRFAPSVSLLLSMTFRFVPRFQKEAQKLTQTHKCFVPTTKKPFTRLKNALHTFSTLVTKTLENALFTADSMKARGYGLPGRTAFSLFSFHKQDAIVLTLTLLLASYVALGALSGKVAFRFYPHIRATDITPYSIRVFFAYALFCALPCITRGKEMVRWKYFVSKT